MSLAQNNGDRAQLDRVLTNLSTMAGHQHPSAETLRAALRAKEGADAQAQASHQPRGIRGLSVALRGTWTGLETLAVLVPWFITLLTSVLLIAESGLLIPVVIAQAVAAVVSSVVVLVARNQRNKA